MTLVLSCLTEHWAVQVSDHRLTEWPSGKVVQERRNKAIQFRNEMLFSYSGLATISGLPTDRWFVNILERERCLDRALERARIDLTACFSEVPDSYKHHAFIGVGWRRVAEGAQWRPSLVHLSNALDANGDWLDRAEQEFVIRENTMQPPSTLLLKPLGARVQRHALRECERHLRKCSRRGLGPTEMLRPIVDLALRVGDVNQTVGQHLLAMFAPRCGVDAAPRGLWMDPDSDDVSRPAFYTVNRDSGSIESVLPACYDGKIVIYGGMSREW